MEIDQKSVEKIPYISLGVLLMHHAGIDIRTKMHRNTYYTHKRVLSAFGYEISYPRKKTENKKYDLTANQVK